MRCEKTQYSTIPSFHHSNCERSELTCMGIGFRLQQTLEIEYSVLLKLSDSRFKGYNRLTLLAILVKIWNTRHTPLGETDL